MGHFRNALAGGGVRAGMLAGDRGLGQKTGLELRKEKKRVVVVVSMSCTWHFLGTGVMSTCTVTV